MSGSVQLRARVCKSSKVAKSPKCPTCGTVLTTVRDDDSKTTLVCKQCSTRKTAEWLATDGAYKQVRQLARKYRGLAVCDLDDLCQEIVVAALEAETAPKDDTEFVVWLDRLAYAVAGGQRDIFLREARAVDGEILQAVVAQSECELDTLEAWEAKEKADKARAARIKRALGKLSDGEREIITERFFKNSNLAAASREASACDSRERTRLWRAKKKLCGLIDAAGYSLAA